MQIEYTCRSSMNISFISDCVVYPVSIIKMDTNTKLGKFCLIDNSFCAIKTGYLKVEGVTEYSNSPVTFYYFGVVTRESKPSVSLPVEFKYTHSEVEESQSGIKCIKCQLPNASVSFHIFFVASQKLQIQNVCNPCSSEHWECLKTLEELEKGSVTLKSAIPEEDIKRIENEAKIINNK